MNSHSSDASTHDFLELLFHYESDRKALDLLGVLDIMVHQVTAVAFGVGGIVKSLFTRIMFMMCSGISFKYECFTASLAFIL